MIGVLRLTFFLAIALSAGQTSLAQVVRGNVKDGKTGTPLAFANVFFNNTTKGTVTDEKGDFLLKSLNEPGSYELVVSFVGYKTYKVKIEVSNNQILSTDVILMPSEEELADVQVKTSRDKLWEKRLKKFTKVFLGDDKLADSCKILNPWVIDFQQEKSGKMLAHASAPIEIDNKALGYKLFFYLTYFWTDRSGYSIAGNVHFSEKQSLDNKEIMQWQTNRKLSYLRSRNHLFKAIIEQRIGAEGFRLYSENGNASIRSSSFSDDLGKIMFPLDTTRILAPLKNGNFKITLNGRVEIHFQNQRAAVRTYRDIPYAVSWVRLKNNHVIVRKDGYEVNPSDVTMSGDMSASRVSQMLPLNYKPTDVIPIKDEDGYFLSQFQEKIYVHTNKSYYYAGEPIWFKGYINYRTQASRDSLSQTVYTELISPEKEIVLSKTLEIKGGFFNNDFILPDSLQKGTYYIRAYTNFNRNFGDSSLFVRPIALLDGTEKAGPGQASSPPEADSLFTITADKAVYRPREKVSLSLQVFGDDGLPIQSNISISVTDEQVVPVADRVSILKNYQFEEKALPKNLEVTYPIEYGLSFSGRFLNDLGKPEITLLNVFNSENFLFTQSNEMGMFSLKGLHFYDSALFVFKTDRSDDKPYGNIHLVERAPADFDFKAEHFLIDLAKAKNEKPVITEYEVPKNARVLKEVEITSRRIAVETRDYRIKRPYGKPDYIITAKDIKTSYGNLLQILPGKVPGLIVRQLNNEGEATKWMVYIQRSISIHYPAEVIVTIDDILVTGSPERIIGAIDPSTVESIEVKTGINVLFGSIGGSGVVAIYLKKGMPKDQISKEQNFHRLIIPGYSFPRKFNSPDYSDPATDTSQQDFRSTIYWNPEVTTDATTGIGTVSFYTADIPGNYRVIAEGVTQSGEPIRCEYYLKIQ